MSRKISVTHITLGHSFARWVFLSQDDAERIKLLERKGIRMPQQIMTKNVLVKKSKKDKKNILLLFESDIEGDLELPITEMDHFDSIDWDINKCSAQLQEIYQYGSTMREYEMKKIRGQMPDYL